MTLYSVSTHALEIIEITFIKNDKGGYHALGDQGRLLNRFPVIPEHVAVGQAKFHKTLFLDDQDGRLTYLYESTPR